MAASADNRPGASLHVETGSDAAVVLRLDGRLDSASTGAVWHETILALEQRPPGRIVVEAAGIDYCDGSGLGLLFQLRLRGRKEGFEVEVRGLRPELQQSLDVFDEAAFAEFEGGGRKPLHIAEEVGHVTVGMLDDIRAQVAFAGEASAAFLHAALHPLRVRWKDALLAAEMAGANAVGIISLIGLLFGLILAFSSAMPLKQFGAEVYVSDLVAISLVRVLGPFITAIILAGRTGSAFAAELGTMKINNEIDALSTMGFDPVRFLVVPRVLAVTFVAPLLAILTNLSGLIGSAFVIRSLGYPLVTYIDHVQSVIDSGDVLVGLFKALVFGALVGGVSCLRGLQTKTGPSAVGISTTRAVVSSIVLLVAAEGVFSVLLYYLDI